MKRDFDLVRHLLFQMENSGRYLESYQDIDLGDWSEDEVGYALNLMQERQLMTAIRSDECSLPELCSFHDMSLTWEGHDFLDSVRDPEIWKKTKAGAAAVGGLTFDLVKELAKGFVKTKLQHHTGLELDF